MAHPRYRLDNGQHVIDVQLGALEQAFDNRDPAPFRQRDLDPDLVEYLFAAAEDLAPHGPFRVELWFETAPTLEEVEPAFRAHFTYELERLARRRRRQRRTGQVALVVGVTLLAILLGLAQLVRNLGQGPLTAVVSEGLVILSWIMMWRPVEALLYDWLPVRRERALFVRLLEAPISIRAGRMQPAV